MSKLESHSCLLKLEHVPAIMEPHSVSSTGGLALVVFLLLCGIYCRYHGFAHIVKAFAFLGLLIP